MKVKEYAHIPILSEITRLLSFIWNKMACVRLAFSFFAASILLSAGCIAQEYKNLYKSFKEVPDIYKGDDGKQYVMVGEGVDATRFLVAKDDASKNLYFVNTVTSVAQWTDPRGDGGYFCKPWTREHLDL